MYKGFEISSLLPSIIYQRQIQQDYMNMICNKNYNNFIQLGGGDGQEFNYIFQSEKCQKNVKNKYILDKDLSFFKSNLSRKNNIIFIGNDYFNINHQKFTNYFDIIQMGFFFHDINYLQKLMFFKTMKNWINSNGKIILSDIFIIKKNGGEKTKEKNRLNCVNGIFNLFINEVKDLKRKNEITENELNMFLGDNKSYGQLYNFKLAKEGKILYTYELSHMLCLLKEIGFNNINIFHNKYSKYLKVLTAEK